MITVENDIVAGDVLLWLRGNFYDSFGSIRNGRHLFCFFFVAPQAAQTLFVIYIRDSIALCFEPFKRMYENGSKIALNLTCSKGFK